MLFKLAWNSLLNRKIMVMMTVLSITISVFVLLGVEHIRQEARNSFTKTVSGTDLIVGARTGQLNLLLYSVFRVGNATNNISWDSYQRIQNHPKVKWTIPISLGDSHKGYRVMGTTPEYFEFFRYGDKQALAFREGRAFNRVLDAVLGYEVAKKLHYSIGDEIVLSHGLGNTSFSQHSDNPFTVVGILEPTGTPVDQTVHVSLQGITAIHVGWKNGVKIPGQAVSANELTEQQLTPESITAILLGLTSKIATFSVQHDINNYRGEALVAILPGVVLSELWQMMGNIESILLIISALVLLAALIGMATMLLASMRERQRELAILRAVGASPWFVFTLVQLEVLLITTASVLSALGFLFVTVLLARDTLSAEYGLFIGLNVLGLHAMLTLAVIFFSALAVGMVPALAAYRGSLHQGLTVRQ